MTSGSYVLVTPVRNEEATIGITLESVVRQTLRPVEWVIVSDGSTDGTDRIVREFADRHPFIRLLRLDPKERRSFSSVVRVTEAGLRALQSVDHDFIGLLDADVRFGATYYADLVARLSIEPSLGVVGGLVVDCIGGRRVAVVQKTVDVAGAVQFFRRECFDSLGGLVAIPEGGWDVITCVQARALGFTTRTFYDMVVDHLKPRNSAQGNLFRRCVQLGVRDHALGNHPLFEAFKCGYRCVEKPYFAGAALRYAGYLWSCLTRRRRVLAPELVTRIRGEQLARLRQHLLALPAARGATAPSGKQPLP